MGYLTPVTHFKATKLHLEREGLNGLHLELKKTQAVTEPAMAPQL